eukprot:2103057-Rhodomonas_salina.1
MRRGGAYVYSFTPCVETEKKLVFSRWMLTCTALVSSTLPPVIPKLVSPTNVSIVCSTPTVPRSLPASVLSSRSSRNSVALYMPTYSSMTAVWLILDRFMPINGPCTKIPSRLPSTSVEGRGKVLSEVSAVCPVPTKAGAVLRLIALSVPPGMLHAAVPRSRPGIALTTSSNACTGRYICLNSGRQHAVTVAGNVPALGS